MIVKRLFDKITKQHTEEHRCRLSGLDLQIASHYGIPYTTSILAFDRVQRLLAIGTLDGRIKVIGGDNIECLLISPKKVPYKYLEFLHNHGFIVGVTTENEIQVWNLELRQLVYSFQWEANVTAFSVIFGTYFMYVGDENGLLSVIKCDEEDRKLLKLPYQLSSADLSADISFDGTQSIVGILPQSGTSSTRMLVAYEKGLLVLWDVNKREAVSSGGHSALKVRVADGADSLTGIGDYVESMVANYEEENEICSLCWVSANNSIAAVGYINGDVLLWDFTSNSSTKRQQSGKLSNNVVKLQLTSAERRLPVIILHWSANSKGSNETGGQLFIYGGDEIGSEEVLTVLTLEWSSGVETLKCISRVNLNLNGSFADMILIPNDSISDSSTAALFVLTNPGQLSVYDGNILSELKSDGDPSVQAENFPVAVPTIDPNMTVNKLCLLPKGSNSLKVLFKRFRMGRLPSHTLSMGTKWPVTGGVPPEVSYEDYEVEKIFIAGYQDGSVRIWDATYPVLVSMFVLEGKLPAMEVEVTIPAVTAVAFCPLSMTLAIGDECGLVRIYKLQENANGSSFHFVTQTNHEVHMVHHAQGFHCLAAFSILNSPITTIQLSNSSNNYVVGFHTGQVMVLDIASLAVLFCTDCALGTKSTVISTSNHTISQHVLQEISSKQPCSLADSIEVILTFTRDSQIAIIDSRSGVIIGSRLLQPNKESVAVSIHVIEGSVTLSESITADLEKCSQNLPDETSQNANNELTEKTEQGYHLEDALDHYEVLKDPLLVICFTNAICFYSLKSAMEGNNNFTYKVNLSQKVCWSMTLKVDDMVSGLVLLYETGTIEIRCLPGLEIKTETSLMSILRWSFKTNMDKTMSFSDDGNIALVNGCEVACISCCGNKSRFLESLPCLHDKVLAAAAEAAINQSIDLKRKQSTSPGIIGGLIRGLKGGKTENDINSDRILSYSSTPHLEELFSKFPFSDKPSTSTIADVGELRIDDIEIDDPLPVPSTSITVNKNNKKDVKEREKLFQGSTKDVQPRMRSTQEIMTQYKFKGDAAAAAAHAREKLAERQEKLERISLRTAELQNDAENFSNLAHELAKRMENKKWWKL
ncbi:uncharacterized protein LOC141830770 isoform X3 [Curcuma longa]|uniref:uncharacterized protein LOC141830770 isoform X3 n=1 Tax=Curcuma longa TaxID=136217 RepID=UPI003D9EB0F0